jgi:hypothetical protein
MLGLLRHGRGEQYLVIRSEEDGRTGALGFVIDAERTIRLAAHRAFPTLDACLKKLPRFGVHTTVILAVSPRLAATILIPAGERRAVRATPIRAAELENLIGQSVGLTFNRARDAASRALGVVASETVLVTSRIGHLLLDKHTVGNPVGFSGGELAATIELTFVPRPLYEIMGPCFAKKNPFFFTDTARASLASAARVCPSPVGFAWVGRGRAFVALKNEAHEGIALHVTELRRTGDDFRAALIREWALHAQAAEAIYHAYLQGQVSQPLRRYLERLLLPLLRDLTRGMVRARPRGTIIVDSELPLPLRLPLSMGKVKLTAYPLKTLLRRTGLRFEEGEEMGKRDVDFGRFLAPFFEFYYERRDHTDVSRLLRRRLQWLGATGQ